MDSDDLGEQRHCTEPVHLHFDLGIDLYSSSNNCIRNLRIARCFVGMMIEIASNNNSIANCVLWGNDNLAVAVLYSSFNTVTRNYVTQNANGIGIAGSNNTLFENRIESNIGEGIALSSRDGCTPCRYNQILENNISKSDCGIDFQYYANNNIICGNTIENCMTGVNILVESERNQFYHNSFRLNTRQVSLPSPPSLNFLMQILSEGTIGATILTRIKTEMALAKYPTLF